jgi:hypothetical protein
MIDQVSTFNSALKQVLLRQHEKDLKVRFIFSDEIEAWIFLFEITMHDWGVLLRCRQRVR